MLFLIDLMFEKKLIIVLISKNNAADLLKF